MVSINVCVCVCDMTWKEISSGIYLSISHKPKSWYQKLQTYSFLVFVVGILNSPTHSASTDMLFQLPI